MYAYAVLIKTVARWQIADTGLSADEAELTARFWRDEVGAVAAVVVALPETHP